MDTGYSYIPLQLPLMGNNKWVIWWDKVAGPNFKQDLIARLTMLTVGTFILPDCVVERCLTTHGQR